MQELQRKAEEAEDPLNEQDSQPAGHSTHPSTDSEGVKPGRQDTQSEEAEQALHPQPQRTHVEDSESQKPGRQETQVEAEEQVWQPSEQGAQDNVESE